VEYVWEELEHGSIVQHMPGRDFIVFADGNRHVSLAEYSSNTGYARLSATECERRAKAHGILFTREMPAYEIVYCTTFLFAGIR
jgi:hypothetical protein